MTFLFLKKSPDQSVLEKTKRLKRELASRVKACQNAEEQINELNGALAAAVSQLEQASTEFRSILDPDQSVLLEKTRRLERELSSQAKACQTAEGQINELSGAVAAAESQFRQASMENRSIVRRHEETVKALVTKHSDDMSKSRQRHDHTIDNLEQKHEIALQNLMTEHGREVKRLEQEKSKEVERLEQEKSTEVERLQQEKSKEVERLQQQKRKEVERLEQEKSKLVGQLLVNQDHNQGWPDDKLKLKFRELQRLMESATSPHRKEFRIPSNQQLGLHLDPTNLVDRAGRGRSHFVLKNVIWTPL